MLLEVQDCADTATDHFRVETHCISAQDVTLQVPALHDGDIILRRHRFLLR